MTSMRASTIAALAAVALLLVVLELIRSRRLQERYALLWLLTGSVMLVLAVWRDGLGAIAGVVGIHYPPAALFVFGSLFFVLVLLHYSTVISKLSDENRVLAQRLALLEQEVRAGPEAGHPVRRSAATRSTRSRRSPSVRQS